MKKIFATVLGIDQGDVLLFSDFEEDGEMWSGEGLRESITPVTYSADFRDAPSVHLSIKLLDMASGSNTRYDLDARNITEAGFDIVFRTWGDTKIARVAVHWQAIGAARYQDDFSDFDV